MMTKMSTTDEQASTSAAGDAEDIQWRFSQIKGNLDVEENPTDGQSSSLSCLEEGGGDAAEAKKSDRRP